MGGQGKMVMGLAVPRVFTKTPPLRQERRRLPWYP